MTLSTVVVMFMLQDFQTYTYTNINHIGTIYNITYNFRTNSERQQCILMNKCYKGTASDLVISSYY